MVLNNLNSAIEIIYHATYPIVHASVHNMLTTYISKPWFCYRESIAPGDATEHSIALCDWAVTWVPQFVVPCNAWETRVC